MKRFQAAAAAYILGKETNVRLSGSPEKIKTCQNVITTSKNLYEELTSSTASMERVVELLDKKRVASRQFLEVVGTPWLL